MEPHTAWNPAYGTPGLVRDRVGTGRPDSGKYAFIYRIYLRSSPPPIYFRPVTRIAMPKKKQVVAVVAPPPKAQGTLKKRTPQYSFDPAAGKDVYQPEKIIAQRIAKGGVSQFPTWPIW